MPLVFQAAGVRSGEMIRLIRAILPAFMITNEVQADLQNAPLVTGNIRVSCRESRLSFFTGNNPQE